MNSELYKLALYPQFLFYVFNKVALKIKIQLIFSLLGGTSMIYVGVISPLVFNYIVIPNIEKKVGKKLEDHPFIKYVFLGGWMCRQCEISVYLINRYCAMKFSGDYGLPRFFFRFGLKKVGYTIGKASKFEITMSFLCAFGLVMFILSGVIVAITNHI